MFPYGVKYTECESDIQNNDLLYKTHQEINNKSNWKKNENFEFLICNMYKLHNSYFVVFVYVCILWIYGFLYVHIYIYILYIQCIHNICIYTYMYMYIYIYIYIYHTKRTRRNILFWKGHVLCEKKGLPGMPQTWLQCVQQKQSPAKNDPHRPPNGVSKIELG